jgi:hypothetical protein
MMYTIIGRNSLILLEAKIHVSSHHISKKHFFVSVWSFSRETDQPIADG